MLSKQRIHTKKSPAICIGSYLIYIIIMYGVKTKLFDPKRIWDGKY